MGRKKILEKRLARLQAKKTTLNQRALASQDANEVRSINEQLSELNEDIQDVQDELNEIIAEEQRNSNPDDTQNDQRNIPPVGATQVNANIIGNTIGSFAQNDQRTNDDPYGTMEYRTAFMNYVQRGTPVPENLIQRAGGDPGPSVAADIGLIIPSTIMNEFIKNVQKVYGQIYSKVRKLNIQGGVKFPISDLKANFKWITETTVSPRQKAGDIKEYIEFSYNIGEIRVSQTLLSNIVSLSLFESEIVRIMVEAYVEAMDKNIFYGTGNGQMLGVFNDPRVTNVIEFTEKEFSDWKSWRKKLFAIIPLSLRGRGEFVFPASTVESNLMTMEDGVGRPLFREATDLTFTDSSSTGRFFGREVTLVEPDVIGDFDTASNGDIIGLFWVPTDYAINTQLQFGIKRYFDEETNQWVNKGLTIVDGKMLDTKSCYIIKKKVGN